MPHIERTHNNQCIQITSIGWSVDYIVFLPCTQLTISAARGALMAQFNTNQIKSTSPGKWQNLYLTFINPGSARWRKKWVEKVWLLWFEVDLMRVSRIADEIDEISIVLLPHIQNILFFIYALISTASNNNTTERRSITTNGQTIRYKFHASAELSVCVRALCNKRGGILLTELQSWQLARSTLISRNKW